MKKLVREKLYEELDKRMSVEEFHNWFYNLYEDPQYSHINWPWVVDSLVNDEVSEDMEQEEYLMDADEVGEERSKEIFDTNNKLIKELMSKRKYFLDFRYIQDLDVA